MKKKNQLYFGTAGVPKSTQKRSTPEGIRRSKELGATAMEIEWVHGVRVSDKLKDEIKEAVKETGIVLTAHAPYYINLNSPEKHKIEKSKQRIIAAIEAASEIGARSVAIHAGFVHGDEPEDLYKNIKKAVLDINKNLSKEAKKNVKLSLETMGKPSQFGSLNECINMTKEADNISFVLDIAHLFARSRGQMNSYDDFVDIFKKIKKELGKEGLEEMHIHLSGIEYGASGERKHVPLKETEFKWKDFLKAMKKMKVGGIVICESPILEDDLKLIMKEWEKLNKA